MTKIYVQNEPAAKLNTISEVVLKKRKSSKINELRIQRQQASSLRREQKKYSSKIKGPAAFIIEAKKSMYDKRRIDNIKKKKSPIFVFDKPQLGVVMRLGGFNGLCEKTERLLESLRLDTYNQAVFVKIDKKMLKKLTMLKPYITWGYPSVEVVNELVTKRAWADIEGRRVKITNNVQVEEHLGDAGILCVADIVHEIVNVTDNFDRVTNFLWPFKLLSVPSGWLGRGNQRRHVRLEPAQEDVFVNDLLKRVI